MISGFLKKLLFARQFSIIDGKIEVLGEKQIMLSAVALMELQNIDKTKVYDIVKDAAKKEMKNVEHAKVYSALKQVSLVDIKKFGSKLGSGIGGVLKNIEDIFEMYGLGKLKVADLNNEKKKANLIIGNSSIAKAYAEKYGRGGNVCVITAAVLAGMFSYLFGKDVNCIEVSCGAGSGSSCKFVVK